MKEDQIVETNRVRLRLLLGILFVVTLLMLDQITKQIAVSKWKDGLPLSVIDGVLCFTYVENFGAAFGSFLGQRILLIGISLLLEGYLLFLYQRLIRQKSYCLLRILTLVIIAGGIGNLIDRVIYGYVIDFIYIEWIRFPVFNLADCYITIGMFVFIVVILFVYKEEEIAFLFQRKMAQKKSIE